jgi:hypothetical protein
MMEWYVKQSISMSSSLYSKRIATDVSSNIFIAGVGARRDLYT